MGTYRLSLTQHRTELMCQLEHQTWHHVSGLVLEKKGSSAHNFFFLKVSMKMFKVSMWESGNGMGSHC